jgi:hypothetical protein
MASETPAACAISLVVVPAKTFLRKKTYRHRQNLRPALFPGHPGAPRRPFYRHLLTQLLLLSTYRKVSTYLPSEL